MGNSTDNNFNNEMLFRMLDKIGNDIDGMSKRVDSRLDQQQDRIEKLGEKIDEFKIELNDQKNKTNSLEAIILEKSLNNNTLEDKIAPIRLIPTDILGWVKIISILFLGLMAAYGSYKMKLGNDVDKRLQDVIKYQNESCK